MECQSDHAFSRAVLGRRRRGNLGDREESPTTGSSGDGEEQPRGAYRSRSLAYSVPMNITNEALVLILSLALTDCKRRGSDAAKSDEVELPAGTEVVSFPSGNLALRGLLLRPKAAGRVRAVLYNHGSAPGLANNLAFANVAPSFVEHGWVFFMPYRRGQGLSASAGPYVGDEIDKAKKNGAGAAATRQLDLLEGEQLDDQLAALEWLKHASFVDPGRIAVAGNSFGGIEALLGAERGGYCAAVDAAGGAESWTASPPLRERMTKAAVNANVPIFFFQAENDFDLSPTRTLGAALLAAHKRAETKIYPAFGRTAADGHAFAYRGVTVWANDVLRFLENSCSP
jgi:carboxymethylenebutenolidase